MAKEENQYGIRDIASGLGITEGMARVKLRKHNIAKEGKSYSWSTKSQVGDVIKQLGEKAPKAAKAAAPAKAAVAKKGAKAAPKKAAKPAAKSGKKAAAEQSATA